jgi:DNA-binding CsgD family transcriptional regulator
MDNHDMIDREQAALKTIQDINSGRVDPNLLDRETRRECVVVLVGEGYSHSHIAQIMKRSEKTISRDLIDIRKKNAFSPSVEFVKETVGEFITKARIHASYLMRIAREKDSSAASRAGAEYLAWKVTKELVEKMQTLGYLPLKPQEVIGHFLHQAEPDTIEEINAMKKQLAELEEQAKEMDIFDDEISKSIALLNEEVKQSEIKGRILEVKKQLNAEEEKDE